MSTLRDLHFHIPLISPAEWTVLRPC